MILKPDKFQAIVLQNWNKNTNNTLNVEDITINPTKSVELLGVTIDTKLNFKERISVLQKYMRKKREVAIINSFINFKSISAASAFLFV